MFGHENQTPQISFTTTFGYSYRVEYKSGLLDSLWTPVAGADSVAGSGNVAVITDPGANIGIQPRRFYRVALAISASATPVVAAIGLINGRPQISFTSATGHYYRVEFKESFNEPYWRAVSGAETITGTGTVLQAIDPDVPLGQTSRFYRVTQF